jgi:hypothetical protein
MAGAGYKLFNTGDVLTAAQVNTYLNEQTVMVFADSAARTTALSGVLAEGMMSYLQDTNAVEVYNGSSWVNVGNAGDITEVQAGVGISIASGTGPIPVITNSSTDLITTAGDLLYGTAADTVARLGIGTVGQVLQVNSGATAPEWATAAAGGGGLTFIKAQTIGTSVTSVTVNDAFSTTYDNYLISVTSGSAAADSADIAIKFGAATSDYKFVGIYMKTTASTVNSFATNSAGNITVGGGSSNGFASFITVINPYLTKRTGVIALTGPTHSDMYFQDYKGFLDNATSYTSFIISSSQNLTGGEIRVYGYQNS